MLDRMQKGGLMNLAERAVRAFEKQAEDPLTPETGQSSAASGDYVPMTITAFDNHLMFWSEVNTDRCLDLMQRIRELDNRLRQEQISRMMPEDSPPVPIWLHIQSGGGDLFTGLNMADQLQTIQTPIYSIVEGVCASAATLISMACSRRFITPSSLMLIHQFRSWKLHATYEEFKDDLHLQDMLIDRMYEFYASRSNLTKTKAKELLRRDSWFNAVECVEIGLVDEILS